MLISRTLWQSCNMKRVQIQARSSIWVELDSAVLSDPEKLKILICGWYWPPENSWLRGQADREALFQKSVEALTEYRETGERQQVLLVGDKNARVGNCCDLKSVLDGVSLVGPPRRANTDEGVNDNGIFVSALCGRAELDLWLLPGRIFNQDWTFWSSKGCSNCDNWIGTSAFLSAREGNKWFTPDSDHKIMSMTFDVICEGVKLDEAAVIRNLVMEPEKKYEGRHDPQNCRRS